MKSNGTVIEAREPQTPEGAIADLFEQVLTHIGEDPARDGLAGTPDRYAKALRFLTQGYRTDIAEVINGALFEVKYDEMVIVRVAETLQQILEPRGVGVICEARHFCMMMRGVEKQHSGAVTSAMLGAFRERGPTREEFLSLVAHNSLQF